MTIILIVAAGALLWGVLFVVQRLVDRGRFSYGLKTRLRRLLPGATFTAWVLFSLWAMHQLLAEEEFYPLLAGGAVLLILGLFGWFVLRDTVAGVIFSSKNPNILHNRMKIGEMKGKVVKLGTTTLRLQSDTGELLSIPYSKVAGEAIAEYAREDIADRFSVRFAVADGEDAATLRQAMARELMLLPWVNHRQALGARIVTGPNGKAVEVSFHCLNREHAAKVEERLSERARSIAGQDR